MKQPVLRALSLIAWTALTISLGCAPPSVEPKQRANKSKSTAPPARVDLPPMLKLEASLPPETHADGDLRVDGLISRRSKYFGKVVQLKGYLVDKVVCPKDAKRCTLPHITLADSPGGDGERIIAVQFEENQLKELEIGTLYVVMGKFARRSDEGFIRSKGLLIQQSIVDPAADEKKKNRRKKRRRRK